MKNDVQEVELYTHRSLEYVIMFIGGYTSVKGISDKMFDRRSKLISIVFYFIHLNKTLMLSPECNKHIRHTPGKQGDSKHVRLADTLTRTRSVLL